MNTAVDVHSPRVQQSVIVTITSNNHFGQKPECPEGTDTSTRTTCTLHTERPLIILSPSGMF